MTPTLEKLSLDVAHYLKLARGNYFTAGALYLISIVASSLAALLTAFGHSGKWPALTSAVPALVLLVDGTFKFRAHSQWHYEKKRRLDSLLRLAIAGATGASDPEVAQKWNEIDESMDERWPGVRELPSPPQRLQTPDVEKDSHSLV